MIYTIYQGYGDPGTKFDSWEELLEALNDLFYIEGRLLIYISPRTIDFLQYEVRKETFEEFKVNPAKFVR
jgi:hypothetical protein